MMWLMYWRGDGTQRGDRTFMIASPGIIGYVFSPGGNQSDSFLHDRTKP